MRSLSYTGLVLLLTCALGQDPRPGWQPKALGQTRLKHAAFVEVFFSEDETLSYADRWTMYVSTFDAAALGALDEVYYMRSPGNFLDSVTLWQSDNILLLDKSSVWPNDPQYMPSSVVGTEGIVQTSGFLVTTKKDGQLQMYDTTVEPPRGPVNLAANDSNEWSYHRVHWQDMDQDGDLDAVTCRFHMPNIGGVKHQFMFFENPNQGMVPEWKEFVIDTNGPDINFEHVTLSAGGTDYDCFIFAEFFEERITIYWTEDVNSDWTANQQVKSRVINPAAGQVFDVLIDDFNRDGSLELMATEFNTTSGVGQAKIYFFPADFRTDDFESVVIADGFIPNGVFGGQSMSPGGPKTYYPSTAYEQELADDGMQHKPWIMLSGDDDGNMYILYPNTEDRTDWTYQKQTLVASGDTTMGEMAVGDLDGDGYTELIAAAYSAGEIFVFTYAP